MKNYGSPNGIPLEEAMQAYLNDHLGEHAPKVGTVSGELVGCSVLDWKPTGNVWEELSIAAEAFGHDLVFMWKNGELELVLQPLFSKEMPDVVKLIAPQSEGDRYKFIAKRTGLRCPHCGGTFEPRGGRA